MNSKIGTTKFINKPEKSQKIIDNILNNHYGIGKEGIELNGMDDAGKMEGRILLMRPFRYSDNLS